MTSRDRYLEAQELIHAVHTKLGLMEACSHSRNGQHTIAIGTSGNHRGD
jgi:hypothetical protein